MRFRTPSLVLLNLTVLTATAQAAVSACPAPEQMTDRDREQVLALAGRMGMQGPLRLCQAWWGQPSGCPALRVESQPIVIGQERSWQTLYLGRVAPDSERQCPWGHDGSETLREGGWVANESNLNTRTVWQFTHDDHQVDVMLGSTVTYEQADVIIKSLRERSWRTNSSQESVDSLSTCRSLVTTWPIGSTA